MKNSQIFCRALPHPPPAGGLFLPDLIPNISRIAGFSGSKCYLSAFLRTEGPYLKIICLYLIENERDRISGNLRSGLIEKVS